MCPGYMLFILSANLNPGAVSPGGGGVFYPFRNVFDTQVPTLLRPKIPSVCQWARCFLPRCVSSKSKQKVGKSSV